MKQSLLKPEWVACLNYAATPRFSFKAIKTGDNCVHLAVKNHQLAMTPVLPRGQSAHFWNKDCFECLSPRILKRAVRVANNQPRSKVLGHTAYT